MSNTRPTSTPSPVSACDILREMFKHPIKNQADFHEQIKKAKSACDLGLVVSPLSSAEEGMLYTYPAHFENERASLEKDNQRRATPGFRK